MQDFRRLRVWHLAHGLSLKVIDAFPQRALRAVPGLRSQAIRASTSISANLAEGCARATRLEFLSFVEVSLASLNELDAHLLLASDTGSLDVERYRDIQLHAQQVRRMLLSLIRTLQHSIAHDESVRLNAQEAPRA